MLSTNRITPEKRRILFDQWVQKSEEKFGKKFATLRGGSITLDELRRFITQSKRMADVFTHLEHEKKSSISFQDLFWNSREDMLIPCSEQNHGLICTTPYLHQSSETGCTKCSGKYQRTEEEFDVDLKAIYGTSITRLDPYINQKTSMMMKCEVNEKHQPFKKTGNDLLNARQGCPRCQIERSSEIRRWKKEEWITEVQKVHSVGKDDYSKLVLEKNAKDILWAHDIFCIHHQKYYCQRAGDHQNGHRCVLCRDVTLSTQFRMPYLELIQRCREIHSNEKFEYDEKEPEDYRNGYSKIQVVCSQTDSEGNIHGIWTPTAHNHINGSGCPHCAMAGWSKLSVEWLDMLSDKLGTRIQHVKNGGEYQIPGTRLRADGFDRITNTIYEFHGDYWHGNPKKYAADMINSTAGISMGTLYQKTVAKRELAISLGYKYVEMWESDWLQRPTPQPADGSGDAASP